MRQLDLSELYILSGWSLFFSCEFSNLTVSGQTQNSLGEDRVELWLKLGLNREKEARHVQIGFYIFCSFYMTWLIHDLFEILNLEWYSGTHESSLFIIKIHSLSSVKVYSICFLFYMAGMCNIQQLVAHVIRWVSLLCSNRKSCF